MDLGNLPNVVANLQDVYKNVTWDPTNDHHVPWQSGMTGLGYDQAKTGDLTSLDALYDPKYKGKVDYLTEMRDTIGLTMLKLGLDPSKATKADCDAAIAEIKKAQRRRHRPRVQGQRVRRGPQVSGNVVLSMAWSGDMVQALAGQADPRASRSPTRAACCGPTTAMIPKGAKNAYTAQVMIDFCYDPAIAAQIEAYVNYICPVKGAAEVLLADGPGRRQQPADLPAAGHPGQAAHLQRPRRGDREVLQRPVRDGQPGLYPILARRTGPAERGSWAASCGGTNGSSRTCCWRPGSSGWSSSTSCPGSRCS